MLLVRQAPEVTAGAVSAANSQGQEGQTVETTFLAGRMSNPGGAKSQESRGQPSA